VESTAGSVYVVESDPTTREPAPHQGIAKPMAAGQTPYLYAHVDVRESKQYTRLRMCSQERIPNSYVPLMSEDVLINIRLAKSSALMCPRQRFARTDRVDARQSV
jgi:hypothetical protein